MKNKKHILSRLMVPALGGASLLSVPLSNAQETSDSRFSLGVLGAIAIENPIVKQNGTQTAVDGKTSFGGGISADQEIGERMNLELDLLYLSREFTQQTAEFFGTSVTSTISSGYIQIPLLLRFKPIDFVSLGAGAYYSRALSSWTVSSPSFSSQSVDYDKNDWGVIAAVGTVIPLGERLKLVADLRYTRSLTDSGRSESESLQFSNLHFLAGVRVNF